MAGHAMPVATQSDTTRRQLDWRELTSLANSLSTRSEGRLGLRSNAWVILSRNPARMMHPPFQMRAHAKINVPLELFGSLLDEHHALCVRADFGRVQSIADVLQFIITLVCVCVRAQEESVASRLKH